MAKKSIQIIGDSLSLHRKDEGILYKDTYPYILSKKYEVIRTCGYGKTTNDEIAIEPNCKYVIVHLGLVDCFPRLYSNKTKQVLCHFPNQLRKIITFIFSHYRFYFTRMFPRVTTEREDFYYNIQRILHYINMSGAKPIIVDIVNVSDAVAKRNYGANENIERYNDYLSRACFIFDCERVRLHHMTKHYPEMLHTDGQHLSKIGHRVLAGLIDDTIEGM
jgi:hypothetical protein